MGCDWVLRSCVEIVNVFFRFVVYVCIEGRDEGKDGVRVGFWFSSFYGVLVVFVLVVVL